MKFSDYFSKLITDCLDKYDSDEEYKNKIAFYYFLENNHLLSNCFEKCINSLSHEELKLHKENDIKTLIKLAGCMESSYSIDQIISTATRAKINIFEEDDGMKIGITRKTIYAKNYLNV